jgi:hypothetical protein
MLPTPERTKTPLEARALTFEFSDKLAPGDTLTGSATITPATGITAAGTLVTGTKVNTRLSGGTDGRDYLVTCRIGTTLGDTLELDVLLLVRAGVN